MQLTYRGQAYEVSATPAVDAIATVETATFLGRPYARKQFTVIQRHQATTAFLRDHNEPNSPKNPASTSGVFHGRP